MPKQNRKYEPNQRYLLPTSPGEWLQESRLAKSIRYLFRHINPTGTRPFRLLTGKTQRPGRKAPPRS